MRKGKKCFNQVKHKASQYERLRILVELMPYGYKASLSKKSIIKPDLIPPRINEDCLDNKLVPSGKLHYNVRSLLN